MSLPVNIQDLLSGNAGVEWERLELKAGWNPVAVLHSVCAFANDLHDWGGGYIIVGVVEDKGRPVLPPHGLPVERLDEIQKELLNLCNRLTPLYLPVSAPVELQGRLILVIWVPGGQNRPYRAPASLAKDERRQAYYVRAGSNTVKATGAIESELLDRAAKIPFDDRTNHRATLADLQLRLIHGHLRDIKSDLADAAPTMNFGQLCRNMRIVDGPAENLLPRNVGLLFFADAPEIFFEAAWIDVVHMPDGPAGHEIRSMSFKGPLDVQLRAALAHIKNTFIEERTIKRPDRAEVDRFSTYPYSAVEEALANAVYHRGYDVREPIEVRITPTEMTITSYPGPDASVRMDALQTGDTVARRYRNRRVGEFLKELRLTEGRGTGIPTIIRAMRENGSPAPQFETDPGRSFFITRLRLHPMAREPRERHGRTPVIPHVVEPPTENVRAILARPRTRAILRFASKPRSRADVQHHLGLTDPSYLQRQYLRPLMAAGLLVATEASAKAPNQRYVATAVGRDMLARKD